MVSTNENSPIEAAFKKIISLGIAELTRLKESLKEEMEGYSFAEMTMMTHHLEALRESMGESKNPEIAKLGQKLCDFAKVGMFMISSESDAERKAKSMGEKDA